MRRCAVAHSRWLRRRGKSEEEAAALLGLPRSTLSLWEAGWREERLAALPRGRPTQHAEPAKRLELLEIFRSEGTGVSMASLQARVGGVARRELADLRARVGRAMRRRRWASFRELEWTAAGRVWAADFTQPPCLLEDGHERLLLARDLGSEQQLLAQPVASENAEEVELFFGALFAEVGPPLVAKLDNGSGFIAARTRELFESWGVLVLYSPPYRPSYNGACEAGGGGVKLRVRRRAASQGHHGVWTLDDVEAARLEGNALPARGRETGPSREELWRARTPISPEERALFRATYRENLGHVLAEAGLAGVPLRDHATRATVERRALVRALTQRGYLVIRRGRVCPPDARRKASGIS